MCVFNIRHTCAAALLVGSLAVLSSCRPGDEVARAIISDQAQHPAGVYGGEADSVVYSPFNLVIQPMERLILINIEQDPDTVYVGFEPQVFDDPAGGTGMLILAYRADGRIDVYHQPGVNASDNDYSVVGQGLGQLVEQPMEGARFDITPAGIDLSFSFIDVHDRLISVSIRENARREARPFGLLAPLGSGTAEPPFLPVFLMHDFYFVRRRGTEYQVLIDGRSHELDRLPLPMDRQLMLFTRYSADPLIACWNASHDGPLMPLVPAGGRVFHEGVTYDLVTNDGHREILRMSATNGRRGVSIDFRPAMPAITSLRDGATAEGRFVIAGDPATGFVSGTYRIERRGQDVHMLIHPAGGWTPNERRLTPRIIYAANRWFRDWPTEYRWLAVISLDDGGHPTMQSGWTRGDPPTPAIVAHGDSEGGPTR